jgi:hypothetical protein
MWTAALAYLSTPKRSLCRRSRGPNSHRLISQSGSVPPTPGRLSPRAPRSGAVCLGSAPYAFVVIDTQTNAITINKSRQIWPRESDGD